MILSSTSIKLIEQAIKNAINEITNQDESALITDFHMQINTETGVLSIQDDDEQILAETEVEEWIDNQDDNFNTNAAKTLSNILQTLKDNKLFESVNLLKPYSFVLTDLDGESIEELLLLDDDLLIINEELLKGLDEELDDFLKNLLAD